MLPVNMDCLLLNEHLAWSINMTSKTVTCFYIGLKIFKVLCFRTKCWQQSFAGFQPQITGSEVVTW